MCGDVEVSRIARDNRGHLCNEEESEEEGVHAWSHVRMVLHNRHILGARLMEEEGPRLVVEEASWPGVVASCEDILEEGACHMGAHVRTGAAAACVDVVVPWRKRVDEKGGMCSTQVENHVNKKKRIAKVAVTQFFFDLRPRVPFFAC